MITSADRRVNADQIKLHPFFFGVDWNAIRHIDAPFVPHLRSITDTSYFPTDELDQVAAEEAPSEGGGASQDLAFLGYVFLSFLATLDNGTNSHGLTDIPSNDSPYQITHDRLDLSCSMYLIYSSIYYYHIPLGIDCFLEYLICRGFLRKG